MQKRTQGMNWIRKEKRLALYMRDGMACVYCGNGVEDGITLTLDHLHPYSDGGSNDTRNLVTACKSCNSRRGTRTVLDFCEAVAGYINHGVTASDIMNHIANCQSRVVDVKAALAVMNKRRAWTACLK